MRILRLSFAVIVSALWLLPGRAQQAVLVLSPAPTVTVRAGSGSAGFGGDGGAATAAHLAAPAAMASDAAGNLYIADTRNHRIRRVASDGTITTIAGSGQQGFAGDGGPATGAQLNGPSGLAVAADGTLFIADTHNHRIRHIDRAGNITTVAGTGIAGFSGDGGSAVAAQFASPLGLAPGLTGDLYIADAGNHRIRHIDANGNVATVAGDGVQGLSPDGTQATLAHLNTPAAVTVRSDGSVLIADRGNDRVVTLGSDGTLRTLNTGSVALHRPGALTLDSLGNLLIADTGNYRVAQLASNGSGSALGSGVQGTLDPTAAPSLTALGAPVSVIDAGAGTATPGQFAVLDRDQSQVVQVSLPTLTFPETVVASSSLPRSVVLQNPGTAPVTVTTLQLAQPFSAADSTCGTTPFRLAAGSSCTLGLVFEPQTVGPVSTLLQVAVQGGLPQRVSLNGTGLPTGTQLRSSTSLQASGSLVYAGTPLALTAAVLGGSTTAATGTVTFLDSTTELGTGTLNAAGQATFSTSSLSSGTHTLSARYNGDTSYLASISSASAITVAIPPDFTMTAVSGTSVSVPSGSTGTLSLTLQPVSGVLNQTVTVAVSGLPPGAAVTVTPIPVLLASAPVSLNIAFKLPVSLSRAAGPGIHLALLLPVVLLCGVRERRLPLLLAAVLISFLPLLLQGCGGGYLSNSASVSSAAAGSTYPVVVTATCPGVTGAALTHSTTFTVVVKP